MEQMNSLAFEVCDSKHGGKGVFAKRAITRGELILCEEPLLIVDDDDETLNKSNFDELDAINQARVMELEDSHAEKTKDKSLAGIIRTNSYPTLTAEGKGTLLYIFSRFNHSCTPTIMHKYNDLLNKRYVYASRDIAVGEELFSNYVDFYASTKTRREELQSKFGFKCQCTSCSATGSTSKVSDSNRSEIKRLDDVVYENIRTGNYEEANVSIEKRIDLLEKEDLATPDIMYRIAYDGYQCEDHRGNAAKAVDWLLKCRNYSRQFLMRETFDCLEIQKLLDERKPKISETNICNNKN